MASSHPAQIHRPAQVKETLRHFCFYCFQSHAPMNSCHLAQIGEVAREMCLYFLLIVQLMAMLKRFYFFWIAQAMVILRHFDFFQHVGNVVTTLNLHDQIRLTAPVMVILTRLQSCYHPGHAAPTPLILQEMETLRHFYFSHYLGHSA